MHRLYLSIGSNLGNREKNIAEALRMINTEVGHVVKTSTVRETEPWGYESTHRFLNAACAVDTTLTPEECLEATQDIERRLGRTQKTKDATYHDRTIDIDLLTYDNININTPQLTLPHPRMQERDFVMIPLNEIIQ